MCASAIIIPTHTLDNRHGDCASGFVKLLEIMECLTPGEILEVLSADPTSKAELRSWTERSGNPLLQMETNGPFWHRTYRYLIQRGPVSR